jgi:poly-beta-hydroxybutyrate-responsive repressor
MHRLPRARFGETAASDEADGKMPNDPALPKNFLTSCLLLLLRERPDHGYDLVERLAPFGFDGSDPGRVYRALRLLESRGHVRSAWRPSAVGPARRVYELTPTGEIELQLKGRELAHAHEDLVAFLGRYDPVIDNRGAGGKAG